MIVWVIGLAGAGKTTIGRALFARLKENDPAVVFLDGDDVREIMGKDLGHSIEDRYTNGWRICRLCQYLDRQGISVVCAILSNFHEHQRWNRETYSGYAEVFVDVSIETLEARDQKQLYSGARAGRINNVVGIDIPFHPPFAPDVTAENEGRLDQLNATVDDILKKIVPRSTGDKQ